MSNIIDALTSSFSRLPGIGKKSASRIVNYLLKADELYIKNFSNQILELQKKIIPCSVCGAWTETNPCPICSDSSRDSSTICVVEQPQDVHTIESVGGYTGMFHVLGGVLDPLEGMGPDQLNLKSLVSRVASGNVKEVIVATNPTHAGDATAMLVQQVLSNYKETKVTRLATGIPVGGDLEYLDRLTLARSFRGRTAL